MLKYIFFIYVNIYCVVSSPAYNFLFSTNEGKYFYKSPKSIDVKKSYYVDFCLFKDYFQEIFHKKENFIKVDMHLRTEILSSISQNNKPKNIKNNFNISNESPTLYLVLKSILNIFYNYKKTINDIENIFITALKDNKIMLKDFQEIFSNIKILIINQENKLKKFMIIKKRIKYCGNCKKEYLGKLIDKLELIMLYISEFCWLEENSVNVKINTLKAYSLLKSILMFSYSLIGDFCNIKCLFSYYIDLILFISNKSSFIDLDINLCFKENKLISFITEMKLENNLNKNVENFLNLLENQEEKKIPEIEKFNKFKKLSKFISLRRYFANLLIDNEIIENKLTIDEKNYEEFYNDFKTENYDNKRKKSLDYTCHKKLKKLNETDKLSDVSAEDKNDFENASQTILSKKMNKIINENNKWLNFSILDFTDYINKKEKTVNLKLEKKHNMDFDFLREIIKINVNEIKNWFLNYNDSSDWLKYQNTEDETKIIKNTFDLIYYIYYNLSFSKKKIKVSHLIFLYNSIPNFEKPYVFTNQNIFRNNLILLIFIYKHINLRFKAFVKNYKFDVMAQNLLLDEESKFKLKIYESLFLEYKLIECLLYEIAIAIKITIEKLEIITEYIIFNKNENCWDINEINIENYMIKDLKHLYFCVIGQISDDIKNILTYW